MRCASGAERGFARTLARLWLTFAGGYAGAMQSLRLSVGFSLLTLCHCQADRVPMQSAASAADGGIHETHDAGVSTGGQAGHAVLGLDAGQAKDAGAKHDAA